MCSERSTPLSISGAKCVTTLGPHRVGGGAFRHGPNCSLAVCVGEGAELDSGAGAGSGLAGVGSTADSGANCELAALVARRALASVAPPPELELRWVGCAAGSGFAVVSGVGWVRRTWAS